MWVSSGYTASKQSGVELIQKCTLWFINGLTNFIMLDALMQFAARRLLWMVQCAFHRSWFFSGINDFSAIITITNICAIQNATKPLCNLDFGGSRPVIVARYLRADNKIRRSAFAILIPPLPQLCLQHDRPNRPQDQRKLSAGEVSGLREVSVWCKLGQEQSATAQHSQAATWR